MDNSRRDTISILQQKGRRTIFLQKKQLTSGLEEQTTYFEKGTRMTTQAHFSKLDRTFLGSF